MARQGPHWYYEYQCAAGHVREVNIRAFDGETISVCFHREHPYHNTIGDAEVRRQILEKWKSEPKVWEGYKIISVGIYTKKTSIIECAMGHRSSLAPYKMVKYKAGCTNMQCMTLPTFQNALYYKELTQNFNRLPDNKTEYLIPTCPTVL